MTNFKAHERKVAALLGGKRNIDSKGAAACDVAHDTFAVECKTRKDVPLWLLRAMQQARTNARHGQLPIVAIHPHGGRYVDDLVVMRMADFRDWFGDVITSVDDDEGAASVTDDSAEYRTDNAQLSEVILPNLESF